MKRIQMPSSYAVVPDGEKALLGGGGAFRDAWTSFTDHLRFTDFFFRGGLLSLSISFIPKLLFNVVKAGFNAVEGDAKVHLASGAIGGFDVLQTVTLMAEAQKLAETAGIETHTGAKGFRNTPVWADHLLTDTEKTTVFTGNAKQAIATFPRRVNVAVATSLATTGPEITGVTMHSVPGWVGDDHCITAEIEGVKAVVDICSSTSAIAGWSVVALLRNLSSPVCFY